MSEQKFMEATYDKFIFRAGVELVTKSGIMLGLGETEKEVQQVLTDLREVGVTMITMDQYLAPSLRHHPVYR